MFIATLCGMFLTSILIGIVASGVESKLNELRKGTSVVQEENHTTVIGFNNNLFSILSELIEANANKKNECIVVLGEQTKEDMEEAISSHIPNAGHTRIICRSGNIHDTYSLKRCAVEASKSIIINIEDDAETVKTILALSAYLKDKNLVCPELRFIASVDDSQYVETAMIAGEGRAEIIYAKDAIARIIANTCRQHGLSQVLTELFNFSGNEFYFEQIPEMVGKTFKEAMLSFSNAVLVGLSNENGTKLNPDMNTIIGKNDKLVLLEEDDGEYLLSKRESIDTTHICTVDYLEKNVSNNLVVIGSNDKLPTILAEYNKYINKGTEVVIVDDDFDENKLESYDNLKISVYPEVVTKTLLRNILDKDFNNILLLNDDSQDSESSDSQTLLRLILLRNISDTENKHFAITTEMRSAENQRLASQARVDDFVIGSNFASLIMAQVSENPKLISVIDELLDESGSELYMKPAVNYVKPGKPVNSYVLTESAARKGEVYVGYKLTKDTNVIVNPNKDDLITFEEGDQLVVIAEN